MTKLRIYKKEYLFYRNNGFHSIHDIPSYSHINGSVVWRKNEEKHRLNGPAVIYPNHIKEWWENGKHIKSEYPKK